MIWRNIQSHGLSEIYKEKRWQRIILRKCLALPYFPPDQVKLVLEKNIFYNFKNEKDEIFLKFFKYFKKCFISCDNNESGVIYEINFWPSYERVFNEIPRTYDVIEAWHRTLNAESRKFPSSIAKICNILSKIEYRKKFLR
ncbi:hypothetical protein DMUE_2071 [Dictyocoela muelleri]|nr:hypothetical protein DMUE_2071 [Dictyocoela muelleri]